MLLIPLRKGGSNIYVLCCKLGVNGLGACSAKAETMIENPIPTERALLIWQRPLDQSGRRDRCAVAELVQGPDQVSFRYFDDERMEQAQEAGFTGYPGLPIGSENLERNSIDVLMRRLPPQGRADFGHMLERFGLPADRSYSPLSLLAYTGARLTSDSFSICETFDGFETPFSYVFDVAGNRHYQEQYADLEIGEPLVFEREPGNSHDPNAVRITRMAGQTVGYVNRWQAEAVSRWLEDCEVKASVFRVNGRREYPRLFATAQVSPASETLAA